MNEVVAAVVAVVETVNGENRFRSDFADENGKKKEYMPRFFDSFRPYFRRPWSDDGPWNLATFEARHDVPGERVRSDQLRN